MALKVDPELGYRHSYVNVRIWMCVDQPDPHTWGPLRASAQAGRLSVTLTAKVSHVVWDMGDGHRLRCGQGTVSHRGAGFAESPDCGYRYLLTTKRESGGFYTVTATGHGNVLWTASNGQSGSLPVTTSTSVQLEIRELWAVNVQNPAIPDPPPHEGPDG